MSSFKAMVTCRFFEPGFKGGGPIRSLAYIVDSVPDDLDVTLITKDRDLGDAKPYPGLSGAWSRRERASVFYLNVRSIRQVLVLLRWARRKRPNLLYVNSLFDAEFSVVPVLAARFGAIPVGQIVIAPRGELASSALSIKAAKKGLFLRFWSRVVGDNRRILWHATSQAEAADIRRLMPNARIELCTDYGTVPRAASIGRPSTSVPKFVFVSRIAKVKNLDLALRALAYQDMPIKFDIYGPTEDAEYWRRCRQLIDELPSNVHAVYRGELTHSNVREVFANSDCFLFPTKGESYGHVIAESLSGSCPVICSDDTPWTAVLEAGGGRVLRELDETSLAAVIKEIASASSAQRNALRGSAGAAFQLWRNSFAAPNIIEQIAFRLDTRP